MRAATEAPLDVMRALRRRGRAGGGRGVGSGTRTPRATCRVALELLGAGLRGAAENVAINLGAVKDAEYASAVRGRGRAARAERGGITQAAARGGALPAA